MIDEDCKKYLIQAQINEGLVFYLKNYCKKRCFFRWIFVAFYYSALHYFYAFLVNRGDPIPTTHKNKNYLEEGDIELAKSKFLTTKNGIQDCAGIVYEQLYNWSCDVRYSPQRQELLTMENANQAVLMLDRIKRVVYNEIGYFVEISNSGKTATIKEVNQEMINELNDKLDK